MRRERRGLKQEIRPASSVLEYAVSLPTRFSDLSKVRSAALLTTAKHAVYRRVYTYRTVSIILYGYTIPRGHLQL